MRVWPIVVTALLFAFVLYSSMRLAAYIDMLGRPRLCKSIAFVRHAEGTHNRDAVKYADFFQGRHMSPMYVDAELTELGLQQAKDLRKLVEDLKPQLVVSSVLVRALQTAREAFPTHKILLSERCRERIANYTSDKRIPLSSFKERFKHDTMLDYTDVDLGDSDVMFDNDKEIHPDPYNSEKCQARAKNFVDWLLYARPETDIVVVSHWVFMQHLFKVEGMTDQPAFGNAELRRLKLCRFLPDDDPNQRI